MQDVAVSTRGEKKYKIKILLCVTLAGAWYCGAGPELPPTRVALSSGESTNNHNKKTKTKKKKKKNKGDKHDKCLCTFTRVIKTHLRRRPAWRCSQRFQQLQGGSVLGVYDRRR